MPKDLRVRADTRDGPQKHQSEAPVDFLVASHGKKGPWEGGRVVLKGMSRHSSQKIT